ncbi:MAG: type II toxin-antitoxin system PemK/MazF family toxin [Lysobacterales bacterium]
MMRGDLVTIAVQGDFGKPRPALVIQADLFGEHATVTVLPVTSTLLDAPLLRITVQPSAENALQKASQVMIDKAVTVRRDKLGQVMGRIDANTLVEVERCLAVFLGIAR